MTEKLNPCPFCGSSASVCSENFDGQDLYFVSCDDCAVITPCYETKDEAATVWNKRV